MIFIFHSFMVVFHIFKTAEEHFDTVCGVPSEYFFTFPSKELAEEWFCREFNNSDCYFSHDDDLQHDRFEWLQYAR